MQPANILKITTLNKGWRDKDSVLLHACFQLLSDFVEQEIPKFPHINWNVSADVSNSVFKGIEFNPGSAEENGPANTRDIKKEFEELYAWWQEWKKREDKEEVSSFEEEHADYLKENEMLRKLIDLRMYMWT
ncbi:MAG: hypothetical protein AAB221_04060 [Bacteroidota bacterium]